MVGRHDNATLFVDEHHRDHAVEALVQVAQEHELAVLSGDYERLTIRAAHD